MFLILFLIILYFTPSLQFLPDVPILQDSLNNWYYLFGVLRKRRLLISLVILLWRTLHFETLLHLNVFGRIPPL